MPCNYLSELLRGISIDPSAPDTLYGAGVTIQTSDRFGPVYGHAGWMPVYVSSFRYYHHNGVTISFQINTDNGIIDSNENISKRIEERLFQILSGGTR